MRAALMPPPRSTPSPYPSPRQSGSPPPPWSGPLLKTHEQHKPAGTPGVSEGGTEDLSAIHESSEKIVLGAEALVGEATEGQRASSTPGAGAITLVLVLSVLVLTSFATVLHCSRQAAPSYVELLRPSLT